MTGMNVVLFGPGISLLIVTLGMTVLFLYVWLTTHGMTHMSNTQVDSRAGDEGDD